MAETSRLTLAAVCLILLLLLAATMAVTELPWSPPAKAGTNLAIAFAKAGLIAWFYMHLRNSPALVRLFAFGVLLWLIILFGLSLSDWLTR